ncbi:MAG: hypothetical protein AAF570_18700, partial [Bacteroidota bacterium]
NFCEGTHDSCPETPTPQLPGESNEDYAKRINPGHALFHMSQTEGLRLQTDAGNELRLHQFSGPDAGLIELKPAAEKVRVHGALELTQTNKSLQLQASNTGALQIQLGGQTLTISMSNSPAGISIENGHGAQVILENNGDLQLTTNNNSGKVKIKGNLEIDGTLTRQGQVI